MVKSIRLILCLCLLTVTAAQAQNASTGRLKGSVQADGKPVPFASIGFTGMKTGTVTDSAGVYELAALPAGRHVLQVSAVGYVKYAQPVQVKAGGTTRLDVRLQPTASSLNEVVVTGTLKPVSKMESPVPVDVYTPVFFRKNPTPSLFDALQNINGVRPQLNCNVCNTGDIHINGLEGPYTMVMIDGMPIVSALSTVYGLSGIPNSLVERVEIVKGPASTLYGSEAVAGLINIITRDPATAPSLTADVFSTSWREYNADLGLRLKAGKARGLLGVNYFNYQHPVDNNGDGFTDVTLQHRISVFNKWIFPRRHHRVASLAARYYYEDRWGGQMQWDSHWRGTDSVYGESIRTNRVEVIGAYQLPLREKIMLQYSFNIHDQNSAYGNTWFLANQKIAFAQLTWDKQLGRHNLLTGIPFRYTYYNDNTVATPSATNTYLPGVFVQDELKLHPHHTLLLGMRYDYNSVHGNIFTPRFAYKWAPTDQDVLRLNFGTGYRVVSVFTEDHAALTGARTVVITEDLRPEKSWNLNLNYVKKISLNNAFLGLDMSAFYTRFSNKIIPDYDTSPDSIIYSNLNGHAISRGLSLNADLAFSFPLKVLAGATLMDVYTVENNGGKTVKERPMLTEKVAATWTVSYTIPNWALSIDYTGNLYGPMRLPLLGDLDPRPANSPVWSLQNIQLTKRFAGGWEVYGGVKNLLNFTPRKDAIARPFDPFDKHVSYDRDGNVLPTPDNPYALTFDPSYVYAPNQGIRGFLGVRWTVVK
ncbi:TonB-dependent receptor [Chitinophaga japonensis]|uniref:Outer membrane receptor for ferrienterochelin and colicins n=1 Tax=Chitinophaga japonensis TaxID=104662 RepID=A0A562TDB7_CHIJA|nr:TonB-dependent receptor [Chitinophaga japonensis]TWI91509.1 outer membrane receptor for ferrienterochelin and colicins [Chitinophaga japonensis]